MSAEVIECRSVCPPSAHPSHTCYITSRRPPPHTPHFLADIYCYVSPILHQIRASSSKIGE